MQQVDSVKVVALYDQGVALEHSREFRKAMVYYRLVGDVSLINEYWTLYIKSQNSLSWMHYELGQYDSARIVLHALIKKMKGKGDLTNSYVKLGRAYSRLDQHDSAIYIYKQGFPDCSLVSEKCKIDLTNYYNQLSIEFWYLSQFDSVLYYQEKNITVLKTLAKPDYTRMANSVGNMGLARWKQGQLHLALEYFTEAERYLRLSNSKENNEVSLMNLGGINIELRNFDVAISYFRTALSYTNDNKYYSGILYHNIGECFTHLNQYDSALYYTHKALQDKADHFGSNHSALASTYASLGTIQTHLKHYELAADYYQKALAIGNKYLAPNDPDLIAFYNLTSQHYAERKLFEAALSYTDTAMAMNYLYFPEPANQSLSSKKSKREYLQSLGIRAGVFWQTNQLNQAISNYENMILYYDSIIYTAAFNTEKHFYKEGSKQTSNALMELYAKSDNLVHNRSSFELSEKNKSAILRLSLDEASLTNSLVDTEMRSKENKLKSELTRYRSRLLAAYENTNRDQQKVDELLSKIFLLNRELESFKKELAQKYPQYFNLRYATQTVSVKEIQKNLLKPDQALIEYFLGDSAFHLFAITTDTMVVKRIGKDAIFDEQLKLFKKSLHQPEILDHSNAAFREFTSSAYYLYKVLIAPVDSLIAGKELIIVPDGELALIPFEALLKNEVNTPNDSYHSLPYLLIDYTISYANSATLLYNESVNSDRLENAGGHHVLAFAPQFSGLLNVSPDSTRNQLAPLNWSDEEVSKISTYFKADVYRNSAATEERFKQEAGKYEILHIASHGLIDDEEPMHSKIAFSMDESDTLNDGYLHTFELYNFRLNAEMAVLSACNTGNGKILRGEGVSNLARGFFYAGCKSVVMSLWVANDRSASYLMNDFYKYLAADQSKSKALQSAKLAYIENQEGIKAHPYYWSQFILSGNTEAISTSKSYFFWIVAGLAGAVCLLGYGYIKVRN